MMKIQFNKFNPIKLLLCNDAGLIIPKITSKIVIKGNITKTVPILFVLEKVVCEIIISFVN